MSTQPPAGPPRPASLAASMKRHQGPILLGGAGLVALVAYLRRGSSTGGTAGPGASVQPSTGGAAFDSSATDVYNALQPQLEQTQGMLARLLEAQQNATTTPPARVPTPPPVVKPAPAPPRKKPPAHAVTPPKTTRYTVRKGDSLSKIGARFGVSWQRIYQANRAAIRNPNLIYPGQSFVIPR